MGTFFKLYFFVYLRAPLRNSAVQLHPKIKKATEGQKDVLFSENYLPLPGQSKIE